MACRSQGERLKSDHPVLPGRRRRGSRNPYASRRRLLPRIARFLPPGSPNPPPPPTVGRALFIPPEGIYPCRPRRYRGHYINSRGYDIMNNYCQLPELGEVLYRCGWTAAASPIGVCQFAVSCPVYQSQCTHRAGGYCISSRAQAAADTAAERRITDCQTKKRRWPRFSRRSGVR